MSWELLASARINPDTRNCQHMGALVCQTFVVGLWGVGVWGVTGEPVVVFHSLFIVKSKMVI